MDDKISNHIAMSRRQARQRLAEIHIASNLLMRAVMDESTPTAVRALIANPVLQDWIGDELWVCKAAMAEVIDETLDLMEKGKLVTTPPKGNA
jgi:hypothetical protein